MQPIDLSQYEDIQSWSKCTTDLDTLQEQYTKTLRHRAATGYTLLTYSHTACLGGGGYSRMHHTIIATFGKLKQKEPHYEKL